jgi:uncharacterized membrane protein YhaH (DUF805 family)
MQSIIDPIRYNLRSLIRFSGRDSRGQFWPYAVFVYLLISVLSMVAALPLLMGTFARAHEYAQTDPDKADINYGPGHYSIRIQDSSADLMPDFSSFLIVIAACCALTIGLLAASVVRRLHDTDRSGLWAVLPLPFLFMGLFASSQIFGNLEGLAGNPGMFVLLFLNNLVYLATLGVLVILLILRGTAGPNRFGQPPEQPA